METTRLWGLPVHHASDWIFNCYIVEAGDGAAIVDAGLKSTANAAAEIVQALGRDQGGVSVSATHGHSDHVGGMPTLRSKLAASTHLPQRCERYLEGESPRRFGFRSMLGFAPMITQQRFSAAALCQSFGDMKKIGFAGDDTFRFPYAPDAFLSEGDALPGAPDWRVLEVPGHTDDALCFYHPESETLLSGDAVVTLDGRAWFNPEWVDAAASRETEERLRALPVRHLLPGHGHPLDGDVWARAMSFTTPPPGRGLLARCARAFGPWPSR
jgi:glyoxylase-like metal-dependent hydrolase (beta-lactamase superfamily II)